MENLFSSKIEEYLIAVDFSHGHEQTVWGKILLRLESDGGLSFDELDDAAGGISSGNKQDGGLEDSWKK